MKRILTLAAMILSMTAAYGQRPWNGHKPPVPPPPPGNHSGHHHGPNHHEEPLREVHCTGDWQELWNGCHVRLRFDKVYIYTPSGDRVLSGDAVVLLPNGYYNVKKGEYWRIYDPKGDRVFNVWGDRVELMENGIFRCYRNGLVKYYDVRGNERR